MSNNHWLGTPAFKSRGFYLHACWHFNYPFAVRSWTTTDYQNMFRFLQHLHIDRVMLWPMLEIAPEPLSPEDKSWISNHKQVINAAHDSNLDCWMVTSPNLSVTDDIRSIPIEQRHFYPYRKIYRFDDEYQYHKYIEHIKSMLTILNNADGYVFIDGDPGGYPGAKPDDFVKLFHSLRDIIDETGTHPQTQKVIPWIWCGWGTDWETEGPWKPDLKLYVPPVLQALKRNPPGEPWELLPGRSAAENWANGRMNFLFTENEGLIDRSTMMLYEIIEYEPSSPAVTLQFNRIRRVVNQEIKYGPESRGVMGNAQTPVLSLPNLYYFSRCTWDPQALNLNDQQILHEFAEFLGGSPEILTSAWSCLNPGITHIDQDLPARLRESELTSESASFIPGSPNRYLDTLAQMVETRSIVLNRCSEKPAGHLDAARRIADCIKALFHWWTLHKYVFSGEHKKTFDWAYTSPYFLIPLISYIQTNHLLNEKVCDLTGEIIRKENILPENEISPLLDPLFKGEVQAWFPE